MVKRIFSSCIFQIVAIYTYKTTVISGTKPLQSARSLFHLPAPTCAAHIQISVLYFLKIEEDICKCFLQFFHYNEHPPHITLFYVHRFPVQTLPDFLQMKNTLLVSHMHIIQKALFRRYCSFAASHIITHIAYIFMNSNVGIILC